MTVTRRGDVEIYYESFGAPGLPTLLLVNGLGSQCINYRAEWCEEFVAAGFHVIRFDNRDVGLSTHFHGATVDLAALTQARAAGEPPPVPYTLSDMAADAIAVLDASGVDRAHVMGLSMGGMIVQTLAIEHPERLLSMTSVMSTTGESDVGQASPEAQTIFAAPPPTDRATAIQRHIEGLRVWGSPACLDEERLAQEAGAAFDRAFDPEGRRRQTFAIFASGSRADGLRSVTVPTLVIHGDADRLIDPSGGRRTAELVPGARLVIFEGMGHDYPPEYWDRWVATVADHALART
jgi:pimeloyl-ACP methyl ester carboxylesterase